MLLQRPQRSMAYASARVISLCSSTFNRRLLTLVGGRTARSVGASGSDSAPVQHQQQARMLFSGPDSEKLRQQSCGGACSRDTPKVTPEELGTYMCTALLGWRLNDDHSMLTRKFTAKNFVAAINFFNAVMKVAEEEGHHPDLHLTNFREVEVNVFTHAVGGITMPDLVLAAKLDAIDVEYSPKWLKQQQEAMTASAKPASAATTGT